MFVRDSSKLVMKVFQTKGREVAVHVEGIEMSLEGCILPLPCTWHTHSAFLRWQSHCHEVE